MRNRPKVAVILDYACIDERVGRIYTGDVDVHIFAIAWADV